MECAQVSRANHNVIRNVTNTRKIRNKLVKTTVSESIFQRKKYDTNSISLKKASL